MSEFRVQGSVKNESGERLSALRRPSGEKNWIREREREMKRDGERGTEGKNDTARYHRYTVEWVAGEVIR